MNLRRRTSTTFTRQSKRSEFLVLICFLLLLEQISFCQPFSSSSVNLGNVPQNVFVRLIHRQHDHIQTVIQNNKNDSPTNSSSTSDSMSQQQAHRTPWFSFPFLRPRVQKFPSIIEFPAQGIQDSHVKYLQRHQMVRKRLVLKRMLEITTILGGQILRPLLCSLVQTMPPNFFGKGLKGQSLLPTDHDDWDDFWNQQHQAGGGLTNAQRVAQGIPALGPTFVKAGQILATRPDILHVPLAEALGDLQDKVPPFDGLTAKRMIRNDIQQAMMQSNFTSEYIQSTEDFQTFIKSLSKEPVAAASVAQVYKGRLPGYGPVAVKVLRPGIRAKVERDATLFHSVATWLESWNNNSLQLPFVGKKLQQQSPLGSLKLVQSVDEFTARVLEDMDFTREAENIQVFADLYDSQRGTSPTVQVVVPEVFPELCSERVLVMEWLEGTKLTDICGDCDDRSKLEQEHMELIVQAMECTISQLIDYGLLHGDPHAANLLKVYRNGKAQLGYLDFGLVSYIPQQFRDGIVCAVVQLVFARNIQAVAELCGDLGLLPHETLQDPKERERFIEALQQALDEVLIWHKNPKGLSTDVPKVRFENLLPAVSRLIKSFEFTLPPYFLNNIRALATLEGIALKLDPNFNSLRVIYPYSINRLMRNPSVSTKVQETFLDICRSPKTKLISPARVRMLLHDWSLWTGYRKRKVMWDLATCAGVRRVAPVITWNFFLNRAHDLRMGFRRSLQLLTSVPRRAYNRLPRRHPTAYAR